MSDVELRRRILRFFAEERRAPAPAEVGATRDDYLRLEQAHALVLGADGAIRIANPFSGVRTGFTAESGGERWDANCAWDALGILAALGRNGVARGTCSDCDEPIVLEVRGGELVEAVAVAHFLVPATRWYDDLVQT